MITIALHNTKGGVGTTTLAAHLCFLCKERGLRVGGVPDPRTGDLAIWLGVADIRCLRESADLDLDVLILDRPALDDLDLDPDLWIIPITDRAGIDHAAALSDRLRGKVVWLGNFSRALTYSDVPIYLLHDIALADPIPYSRAIAYSTERLSSVWCAPDLATSPGAQALRRTLGALLDELLHVHRTSPPAAAPTAPLDASPACAPLLDDDAVNAAVDRELAALAERRRSTHDRIHASRRTGHVDAPPSNLDAPAADLDAPTSAPSRDAPAADLDAPTSNVDAPTSAPSRERDLFDELADLSRALGRAITAAPSSSAKTEPLTIHDLIDPLLRLSPHIGPLLDAISAPATSAPATHPHRSAADQPRATGFTEHTGAQRSNGPHATPGHDPAPRTAASTHKHADPTNAPSRSPSARSRAKSRASAK